MDNTTDQLIVTVTLIVTLAAFASGRIRYDIVALAALVFLTVVEVVPRESAFSGFGHPAVVTVGAVLVVTRALDNSGLVDLMARNLSRVGERPEALVGSHTSIVVACSTFMNNVGALALLMPVAIRVARRFGHARAIVLMPLAFASLLGGMITLVGTPPNIIVATAREPSFAMFDFAPVGVAIAIVGIAYLTLIGWRLIPRRESAEDEGIDIEGYLTELIALPDSKAVGMNVGEVEDASGGAASVAALIRSGQRVAAPSRFEVLTPGDVLVVEADPDDVADVLGETGLELAAEHGDEGTPLDSDAVELVEVVVQPGGLLDGQSSGALQLRERFGVNVVAMARQGGTVRRRLKAVRFKPGDVLLVQVPREHASTTLMELGSLPLAERGLRLRAEPRVLTAVLIFGGALFAAAGLRIVPIELAVTLAALMMGLAGLVTLREAYEAIDWPVLVLLGAMIPVGASLESTGAAAHAGDFLVTVADSLPPVLVVSLVMVIAMMLSDVVNNAAAAVLLIPIALQVAAGLDLPPDALLMAVAVGASSAFLTPIGHQSNVLVMGPGGYRFADYWRVGLPLELLILVVASPLILLVWG